MRSRPLFAALALAALLAVPAMADDRPTMSMRGHGEITAAPDTAEITSGVTTQDKTARAALDANNKAMAGVIAALKQAGVADKDIQTSGFTIQPQYVYPDGKSDEDRTPRITGYQVVNTVHVKIADLDSLGSVLDSMVSTGANTINGISFSVADPSALYDEARKAAFADARHKADLYAEAAGLTLGRVVALSEQSGGGQPPRPFAMKAMAESAAVPVQAGEVSYSVDVSVTWALRGQGRQDH